MNTNRIAALLIALAALAPVAHADTVAVQPVATESALQEAFEKAVWPGDIVRTADDYLRAFPQGSATAEVQSARIRAADALRLIRSSEVRLYRSAFATGDAATERDLRQAVLGDRAAAQRLAYASRDSGSVNGEHRYVGWLQLAAGMGDELASNELAQYFRRNQQALLAEHYQAQATAQGYVPAMTANYAQGTCPRGWCKAATQTEVRWASISEPVVLAQADARP